MTTTSPPTLAQLKRYRLSYRHGVIDDDGRDNYLADASQPMVLASAHDALISTLHSQINGLMKRLLRDEQDARRLDWLSAQCGNLFTPTRDEIGWFWAGNDGRQFSADGLRQLIDSAMASQGGGDG